ncbi:carboxyl-terminal processing protease [Paenibacillus endophyticus]|uniref:Carboxyl-terminal processing protease n=1 Tax=Paenibacillus endophyticus TaxID=1294268 RepID=A0A7W5GCD3_9BACL|nr:S41 family peptidase [Paenibacillus endophyticus]MBB3154358.1 carboxyl-terminal processing protease [Paenibacillus endophyticus]
MNYFTSAAAKQRFLSFCVLGAFLFAAIGFTVGLLWMGNRYPMLKEPAFKQFTVSYNKIIKDYLNGAEPKKLINGAAVGMVSSLEDPYSRYLVEEKGDAYTQSYEGEIFGIGAELREEEGEFVITALTKGAPAERGGLLPEDIIMSVDNQKLSGKTFDDLLGLVRGEEGTNVSLEVQRANQAELISITLKREAIPVHTVTSELLDGGIGHVTISRFAEKTADEFEAAIKELQEKQPLKGLLLDMRSNPGGLLQPTIKIASTLIPKDKVILNVVYKNERQTISYKSKQEKEWKVPIAVLVNGQSASASEVLTAALKESAGATVIGEKTYGKGVVQAFNQFKDGSVLSLTEAQWKTPGGTWINKTGVSPDFAVELPAYTQLRPLAIGTEMKVGSYGEDVKTLQLMLKELGYTPTGQEGMFDKDTAEALRKFQTAEKLEATGSFNDKTGYQLLSKLREKLAKEDSQLIKGLDVLKNRG